MHLRRMQLACFPRRWQSVCPHQLSQTGACFPASAPPSVPPDTCQTGPQTVPRFGRTAQSPRPCLHPNTHPGSDTRPGTLCIRSNRTARATRGPVRLYSGDAASETASNELLADPLELTASRFPVHPSPADRPSMNVCCASTDLMPYRPTPPHSFCPHRPQALLPICWLYTWPGTFTAAFHGVLLLCDAAALCLTNLPPLGLSLLPLSSTKK